MVRRTPSWIERQVEAVVGDYFPQQLTILDRDTCLSLVQVTVDYAAELGFEAVDASDVLVLGDDGTVTVTAPELRLTPRSLYRLPAVAFRTLIRMRHDPMQWVNGELRGVLAEISSLPKELDGLTEPQLMDRVNIGISLRDKVFTQPQAPFSVELHHQVRFRVNSGALTEVRQVALRPEIPNPPLPRGSRATVAKLEAGGIGSFEAGRSRCGPGRVSRRARR